MIHHKNWPALISYIVAIAAFIVVAGYAVMYATGYRIDFQRWEIQKTGILALTTKPSGATVYINDKKYPRETPVTLRNMLPGSYTVKLALEGYRPYSKTIEVVSRQVTEEHNLDLVLGEIPTKELAKDVGRIIAVGEEIIYFNKQRKFVRLSGDKTIPLDLGRLPANVKSVLQATTDVYLAKKSGGDTWALGVVANGRKWLVIADLREGYRGQLFGSPLNQITAEHLSWIDNDRLVGLLGTAVYTIDLNLNKVSQLTKVASGAGFWNGGLYYIIRNTDGSITLMRDGNLFDDKLGEVVLSGLPVGRSYNIVFANDERVIITTASGGTTGLWLSDVKQEDGKNTAKWTKVASAIGNVWYEHHNLKPKLFYTVGRQLLAHDFNTNIEKSLREFPQTIQLLGKQDESLFLVSNNRLIVSDTVGANIYDIGDTTSTTVLLGGDARQLWLLKGNQLTEWTLRKDGSGIFGGLTDLLSQTTI